MRTWLVLLASLQATLLSAQPRDSSKVIELDEAEVIGLRPLQDMGHLPAIQGTYIFSGKKSEVISLADRDAAITEKYGRQLFAKVPGVFVYDMDGTGNQLSIATRGLDPHRGWEFNIREDGILTNSDMYGYPASHYNIPMEAVERIELVRGTGSLQYGAQFGGMLNYVNKGPDTTRAFAYESINTVGSFGLLSTFNRASGCSGKWSYNVWMQQKGSDGYRANSRSDFQAQNIMLQFAPARNLRVRAEWTRSDYVVQIAGPLTDAMFQADARSSTRSRNYYEPDIHVPSLRLEWEPDARTRLQWTTSAVIGERNSVLFDKPSTTADAIDSITLTYANRQVDIDHFQSYTSELRALRSYSLAGRTHTLAGGVQYMHNDLHRQQLGKGTTGTDYDLTLVQPGWGRDLHYRTENIALFLENGWALTNKLTLNTGARMESGATDMLGHITYYDDAALPNAIDHHFVLFGASAEYAAAKDIGLYAGWSQAYRPVLFKDVVPASTFEVVDKNLKDAHGYNLEAGFRGNWKAFRWDVSAFQLVYDNRMGTLAEEDTSGQLTVLRTNIGGSVTNGAELFLQADIPIGRKAGLSVFTSTSYMDARYHDAMVRSGTQNVDVSGNKVESAPEWISRSGITMRVPRVRLSILYSYVSATFADALNTVTPSPTGSTGLVPVYTLLDVNATVTATRHVEFRLNVNNVLDEQYFTKRPQLYPGPGIWPSDGRGLSATVAIRL